MSLATRIAQEFNNVRDHLSLPAAYHLLGGNLSVDATVLTTGFGLYLYTGNGGTQSINLGMDLTTQWGDSPNETYGYLIKIKSRSAIGDWTWVNSVRGITKYISSNTTAVEGTDANMFTLSTVAGVTTLNIGTSTRTNTNGVTYVVEVYQTTHKKTGVTNQGKDYTEHYNPFTGFTIIKYEGSGLAGHEIPHSLGRKLGFRVIKNLSGTNNWVVGDIEQDKYLELNTPVAITSSIGYFNNSNDSVIPLGLLNSANNTSGSAYILYGQANSYFNESGKLIGNYEIGVYQGTGAAGNKVTTRGKPAWVMLKRLDNVSSWGVIDNQRITELFANESTTETTTNFTHPTFSNDGITFLGTAANDLNNSGGQYLYMVVYDNDNGSGKSKYYKATDTANVQINNGIIPLAHGIDSNGSKNSIVVANETITGVTYTEGKNYLYKTDTGYGGKPYKPRYLASELVRKFAGEQPDYYDVESNKWFNCDAGTDLVTNGTFDVNTSGWTANGATLSVVNGTLKVANGATQYAYAYQGINTVIGETYKVFVDCIAGVYSSPYCFISSSVNASGSTSVYNNILGNSNDGTYTGKKAITFVAQTTTSYLYVGLPTTITNQDVYFDNISAFPIDITPTTEITESRNYMNHIVHADADGGVLYVEELPKIEYKNVIKAEEYLGKNACTAWVNFDGTTTPPTILDSYNVSSIVRTGTGVFDVYFIKEMDNINYSPTGTTSNVAIAVSAVQRRLGVLDKFINKVSIATANVYSAGTALENNYRNNVNIFGGRN